MTSKARPEDAPSMTASLPAHALPLPARSENVIDHG